MAEFPGVAGGSKDIVIRVRPGSKLGSVRLAENDGPRSLQPLDDQGVLIGDMVLKNPGAKSGPNSGRKGKILDRNGNAVQGAERPSAHNDRFGFSGSLLGQFRDH